MASERTWEANDRGEWIDSVPYLDPINDYARNFDFNIGCVIILIVYLATFALRRHIR